MAVESSGLPTVPNNMRAQMVKTPTQTEARNRVTQDSTIAFVYRFVCMTRKQCLVSVCVHVFIQPDGAESVSSIQSSDSIPEKMADGRRQPDSSTPSIAVSRASLSSGITMATIRHIILLPLTPVMTFVLETILLSVHCNIKNL